MQTVNHAEVRFSDSVAAGRSAAAGRFLDIDAETYRTISTANRFCSGTIMRSPAVPASQPGGARQNASTRHRRVQRRENPRQPSRPGQDALHGSVRRGNRQAHRGVQLVDGAQRAEADPSAWRSSTSAWTRSSRCRSESSRACASAKPRSS